MAAVAAATRKVLEGPDPTVAERFEHDEGEIRRIESHGTYVVTCAQNDTPVHKPWLKTLKRFCNERGAELIVVPIRYKNPTTRRDPMEERTTGYDWDSAVRPYLCDDELRVHDKVRIMANIKPQATSPNPIPTGRDGRTKSASAVYGHSQLVMRTVATPQAQLPKILYTTGSVTEKNYSDTPTGDMASFHHTHGATLIETDGDGYWMRELVWDRRTETMIDFDRSYGPKGRSKKAGRALAVYTGDEHQWFMDPAVKEATFGDGGLLDTLNPRYRVAGDVLDGYTMNPHEQGRHLSEAVKAEKGLDSWQLELDDLVDHLNETTRKGTETIITLSNHHEFLTRALEGDAQKIAPKNRRLYHWLCLQMLDEAERVEGGIMLPDPVEMFCRGKVQHTRFLAMDESFQLAGVELGMHGHRGSNGARGNIRNFARIGTRSIVGHTHGPGIWQGVYMVGMSCFYRLGYNSGPSSWLQCHAALNDNGKRQMLAFMHGRFRR